MSHKEKLGIHSLDWDKLIEELRKELPPDWFNITISILEKHSTRYV